MSSDNSLVLAVGGIAGICSTIWGAFTLWLNTRQMQGSRFSQTIEEVADLRAQLMTAQSRIATLETQLEIARSNERWQLDHNRELIEQNRRLRGQGPSDG